MIPGIIKVKELNFPKEITCFSEKKNFAGGVIMVITPLSNAGMPKYIYHQNYDGTYTIRGEGHIVHTKADADKIIKDTQNLWKDKQIIWEKER